MADFIPVNTPLFEGNEKKYLLECIETGWISSEGPFVKIFEEKFAAYVGRQYGVAVCNGSSALETAVLALGIGPGDEVIMPTFTIISCAAAVVRAGAKPVLVDIDPFTLNIDVRHIEEKITPQTKAIMVVHIYGLPADMDTIMDLGQKYGLMIIEDAAQMHGQTYRGKCCGSFGDISAFSFYSNKHVTTGEGGMVVTDREDVKDKCRSLRNLCFTKEERFKHHELGFNFRMTNMQAALGLAQLEQIDKFVKKKRWIGKTYTRLLADIPWLQLPQEKIDYAENIYWVYGLVLKKEIGFDAAEAMKRLAASGVGTRPFFWPMHEQPVFLRMGFFTGEKYPIAEKMARFGFYLPSGMAMTKTQIERVAATVIDLKD
jgi:perosamine synthetase